MQIRRDLNQGTKEWFEAKLGMVTGTVLKDVRGTPAKRDDTVHEIIGEMMTPSIDMEYIHEAPMARGTRLEPEAVLAFEYVTGKKVDRVGLCQRSDEPRIGYSPDGLIIGEHADIVLSNDLEIKCPETKNYMKIVMSNKVPKEYHNQMLQGFCVDDELQVRYFVAYNPDIAEYPIHIIPVTRESLAKEIEEALAEERAFLAEVDARHKAFKNKIHGTK